MGSPTESKLNMKLCLSKPVSILILAIAIITIPSSYAMWHHDGRMVPSCSRGSYHRLYPSSSVSSRRRAQLVDPINLMAEIFSVPVTFNSLMRQQHRHFSEMQRSEPRYEISNDETQFQILLDLPGVQAEDVSLELKDGGSLQISASRNTRQPGRMSSYACASASTTAAPTTAISGPVPQLGEYELATGPFNDWHYVNISQEGGRWKWTNRAGVSWSLYQAGNSVLRVGDDCPYYNSGYTTATFNETGIVGPWGEFYAKLGSSSCIYVDKQSQSRCEGWKENGYCEESHRCSNYLPKNCKATCVCGSSSTCDYVDLYDSCPGWKDPYCTSHPNWMARNCPATCNCD